MTTRQRRTRYDPHAIERRWQEVWAARAHLGGPEPRRARLRRLEAEGLRARDAALPLGRAPRRPSEELLDRRRDRPFPPPQRLPGDPPDGLRRLRPAGREQRDQDRHPSARGDRGLDRRLPRAVPRLGRLDRLVARGLQPRARLLPLDAVDLPAPLRARPRLPRRGAGAVVPRRPDGARQRAGDRRPLRALRHAGRVARPRAVVLQDHRLRRPPARRLRPARVLARARRDDAAQLDRPLRGRRGQLPLRGARDRLPGLHHPARHALRRHLLRPRARAPRRSSGSPPAPAHEAEVRAYVDAAIRESTEERGDEGREKTGRRRSAAPSPTRSTASRSRCSSPTTC